MSDKLTPKQRMFVAEYICSLNATQAAVAAGYSNKTASRIGPELLGKTCIQEAIQVAMEDREKRTLITADKVLAELWNIATADTNEIVELRRCCCRYCWGKDNKYQLTINEMRSRIDEYNQMVERNRKAKDDDKRDIGPLDTLGGAGFDAKREPNPLCPECFGDGLNVPFFKDTRNLSPGARSLYAGFKSTKDGMEVKMHSKDKALELLGRHLKLFTDKTELTGKDGGDLTINVNIVEE